jgi:phage/plasmid-like protein (TIGR03299 family)
MSHQFTSGMFVKEPAWHKLGTVLEHKVYSSEEALNLAGANWKVVLRTMEVDGIEVPDKKAVQREDTKQILSVVGNRYVPKQNIDAFKFFDPFLHKQDAYISTAGVLNNGAKVWIAAEIENTNNEIKNGDIIRNYLLLANAHDGSMKLIVKFVSERVVCANTLRTALSEKGAFKAIAHTSSMDLKLSEIQASINLTRREFDDTITRYRAMSNADMTTNQFREYLESLFTLELKEKSKKLDRTANLEDIRAGKKILQAYNTSPDLQVDGVRGTVWAGLNAVTEYVSHQRSSNVNNRYDSIWFGKDSKFLGEAESRAYALV